MANDARHIGRLLHTQRLPLPRPMESAGGDRYDVDGMIVHVTS